MNCRTAGDLLRYLQGLTEEQLEAFIICTHSEDILYGDAEVNIVSRFKNIKCLEIVGSTAAV